MEEKSMYLEPFNNETTLNNYSFYFDEEIKDPSYYRIFTEVLISASQNDTVSVFINSEGGKKSGLDTILTAIESCSGLVNCYLVGEAASAASAIVLACDNVYLSERSSMMIHTASFGYGGKAPDVMSYMEHTKDELNKFITSTYKYFLTEEEINDVINGRDIYLNQDEILSRLQLREEIIQKMSNEYEKDSSDLDVIQ